MSMSNLVMKFGDLRIYVDHEIQSFKQDTQIKFDSLQNRMEDFENEILNIKEYLSSDDFAQQASLNSGSDFAANSRSSQL